MDDVRFVVKYNIIRDVDTVDVYFEYNILYCDATRDDAWGAQ